ncbi:MAG: hypothetical protein LBR36_02515 [Bacteroidales bacterium]|jgi:hypothetical protein|nr:hypothetical protein [Bacteroidales bacterium]
MLNKNRFFVVIAAVMLLGGVSLLGGCRSTDCVGIVYVYYIDNGIKIPVSNCQLTFGDFSDPLYSDEVRRIVITDGNGEYEGVWKNEAYLPFTGQAMVGTILKQGSGFLKLVKGETTKVELMLN